MCFFNVKETAKYPVSNTLWREKKKTFLERRQKQLFYPRTQNITDSLRGLQKQKAFVLNTA